MTIDPPKPDSKSETPLVRSPSYPNMSLGDAVEAVRKIEKPYRTAQVDRGDAAKLLGYTAGSGPSNKALADLASYGLVERAGKGELRVTRRAQAILYPQNPAEQKQALREAAYDPSLFQELRERFAGLESPPEDGIATYLNRAGFNSNSIRPATRAYLATLAYLQQFGATESNSPPGEDAPESPANEGEEMERDLVRSPPPPPPPGSHRRERQMAEGERVLTKGLISRDSTFEIIVTGHVGVKEIETLIRKLQIDKDILADEDDPGT